MKWWNAKWWNAKWWNAKWWNAKWWNAKWWNAIPGWIRDVLMLALIVVLVLNLLLATFRFWLGPPICG